MDERFPKTPEVKLEIFDQPFKNNLLARSREVDQKHTLSLEPFIDLYGLDNVKKDYSKVADRISKFDNNSNSHEVFGKIFESAFLDIGRNGHWFGQKSELVRASKYDDILNGVDVVATIVAPDDSARHLAIASDLTFSHMNSSEKFNRIKNNVWGGKLAEIKYFHSDLLNMTGKLSNVPRTVVGLEPVNLNRFLLNWLREPELSQLQFGKIILDQIATQSGAFANLANEAKRPQVREIYRRTESIVNSLLQSDYKDIEALDDKISVSIKKACERIID